MLHIFVFRKGLVPKQNKPLTSRKAQNHLAMNTEKTIITTKEWAEMGCEKANEILTPMPLLERLEALQNTPHTMTPYQYWIRKSKAELMQWYMNAMTTMSCGGHFKGQRNEELSKEYLQLMNQYNVPVPPNEICYILGVFNGVGAF